jgi:hypothetical protein
MDDGTAIDVVDGGDDPVLQFLREGDADVAEHRAGELGEEPLDQPESRTVLRREDEFEAAGAAGGEPRLETWAEWLLRIGLIAVAAG